MSCFSCVIIIMIADDLAIQGARASVATILTWLSWNIPVSAPDGGNDSVMKGNVQYYMVRKGYPRPLGCLWFSWMFSLWGIWHNYCFTGFPKAHPRTISPHVNENFRSLACTLTLPLCPHSCQSDYTKCSDMHHQHYDAKGTEMKNDADTKIDLNSMNNVFCKLFEKSWSSNCLWCPSLVDRSLVTTQLLGAYLKPSRPSVNLFFKSNWLPQISSDLSNIWCEYAQ